jgi:hypothetical protein
MPAEAKASISRARKKRSGRTEEKKDGIIEGDQAVDTRDRIESWDPSASVDPTNHVFLTHPNDRTVTAGKRVVALAFYRQQLLEKKRRVDGSDSTTVRVETGTHNVND